MICIKCGKEIDDDSVFCSYCGTRTKEPDTIVNDEEEKAPDFLSEGDEPTMLLSDDELQDAFINEYGGDTEQIPFLDPPPDNSRDFFYNSDTAENTDDLMPYNEYRSNDRPSAEQNFSRPKSFNDNSDTISLDALMDDGYMPEPPLPEPYDEPYDEPYGEPYGQADMDAPYDEPYNEPYDDPYDEPYAPPYEPSYDEPYQPPQPPRQPAPERRRKNAPKVKKPAKIGAGRISVAVFMSVFALFFLLLFSLTLSIKLGLSGGIVRNNIAKMDDATLLESEFEGNELSNTLFISLGLKNATGGMATESSFRNYMLRTDFVNYLGRTTHSYLDYLIDGKGSDPSVTAEDFIYDFVKANNRASIEEWGYSMTDNEYSFMAQTLESTGFSDDMSIAQWSSSIHFSLRNLKFLFSFLSIGVFLIIAALLFIWISVVLDGSGKHITGFFGSILNISGVVTLLTGGASVLVPALAYVFSHQTIFYILSHALLTFALIAACTGAAEIILGIIFKAVRKRLN